MSSPSSLLVYERLPLRACLLVPDAALSAHCAK
jgi:hypothetical protein